MFDKTELSESLFFLILFVKYLSQSEKKDDDGIERLKLIFCNKYITLG